MGAEFMGRTRDDKPAGEQLMEVALGLIREVKSDIKDISDKLDKIADERREEAKASGDISARVRTLEGQMPRDARTRLDSLERKHRATAGVAYSVGGALTIGVLYWLLRLAIAHPETIMK